MIRKFVTALIGATLAAAPLAANAATVAWTDWQTVSVDGKTVTGQIMVDGETIDVTYTSDVAVRSGTQVSGGIDYWQNARSGRDALTSAFTSTGPNGNDNIPTGTDIIQNINAATHTLSFSKAIEGLYFSFVSINGNTYVFDQDFSILSLAGQNIDGAGVDARGYWGQGLATRADNGNGTYSLATQSSEPHGTLYFQSELSQLVWNNLVSENWHGFTVGVAGLSDADPVPVPAAVWLFGSVLAAGAAARRSQKKAA